MFYYLNWYKTTVVNDSNLHRPYIPTLSGLTHWGQDEIAAISQTKFSNAFFLNENIWILHKISLKFVPKVRIDNIAAMVQIMAWSQADDKPLSEPMMVILLMHRCATRPQWGNTLRLKQNGCHFTDNIFGCIILKNGEGMSQIGTLIWQLPV